MNCPKCNALLQTEEINIQNNIAKCTNCGNIFAVSASISTPKRFDVNLPPKGAWYTSDFDTTVVGATTRSPVAFFLIPFMLIWSGFSIGGIYGVQFTEGKFNLLMSLFGIPFLIGSVIFWTLTVMMIIGKIEIVFNNESGSIFTGIGKFGFTKIFFWKDIDRIEETNSTVKNKGSVQFQISLLGQKQTSFGTLLNGERRYYILNVLRSYLPRIKR